MPQIILAILVGLSVYLGLVALIPRRFHKRSTSYTRSMVQKLEKKVSAEQQNEYQASASVLRQQGKSTGLMARIFMALPGAERVYPSLLKAGLAGQIGGFFTACIVVFVIAGYALSALGVLIMLPGAFILSFLFGWRYIRRRISRRNDDFLKNFPDALDMLVRSVRSGYPISAAIRMVTDNMQPPVSTEFKQVADEVAYGSTLIEALQRLAARIDEPDVHFFVVVLSVQQDVGGSLAEVLQNLSSIIRKRKYLRMKIKAISSEGRATAWVLGSMPFVEGAIVEFVAPDHLTPLFTTSTGHLLLAATLGIAGMGIFIVKQMVNIKV